MGKMSCAFLLNVTIGIVFLITVLMKTIESAESDIKLENQKTAKSLMQNATILYSQPSHFKNDVAFYAICENLVNTNDRLCRIFERLPKSHDTERNCTTTLERIRGTFSTNSLQLIPLHRGVAVSWVKNIDRRNKQLAIKLIDFTDCGITNISFYKGSRVPLVKIFSYGEYFDVFFRNYDNTGDVTQQTFSKFVYNANGTRIGSIKSFFRHISIDEQRVGNSIYSSPLAQLMPISFEHPVSGYFFIAKDRLHIASLEPDGKIRGKFIKMKESNDPMFAAFGFGKIAILAVMEERFQLITYDKHLQEKVFSYNNYDHIEIPHKVLAMGPNEYVLMVSKECDDCGDWVRIFHLRKVDASGKVGHDFPVEKYDKRSLGRDDFYLSFVNRDICLNRASLNNFGTIDDIKPVCFDPAYLNTPEDLDELEIIKSDLQSK